MIDFYIKALNTEYCQVTMVQGLAIALLVIIIIFIIGFIWYRFFDK